MAALRTRGVRRGAGAAVTNARAITIAIQAIEAEIKRLAVNANLHEMYHADAPACVQASERRRVLREAVQTLKEPQQVMF